MVKEFSFADQKQQKGNLKQFQDQQNHKMHNLNHKRCNLKPQEARNLKPQKA